MKKSINVSALVNEPTESIIGIDEDAVTEEQVVEEIKQLEEKDEGKKKKREREVSTAYKNIPYFTGLVEDMLAGTITSFNAEKGFGFIKGPEGNLYFHILQFREVESCGSTLRVATQSQVNPEQMQEIRPGENVMFSIRIHEKGPYASPWVLSSSVDQMMQEIADKKLYRCFAVIRRMVANNQKKTFEPTETERTEVCTSQEKIDFRMKIKELVAGTKNAQISFEWEVFDEDTLEFVACEKPF